MSPFKVIVAGGGPAGLIAAHCLHQAGINFTVLERKDCVAKDEGASLVIGPGSMRVLQQLGLLDDALLPLGFELQRNKAFTRAGYKFKDSDSVTLIRKNHGTAPVAFHRAELVQVLYDKLPEQAKESYHLGKSVSDVLVHDNGVTVSCQDGSTYKGSILLGADGVYSKSRKIMRRLALEEETGRDWDPEDPFPVEYKCLWCSFPLPSQSGESSETQHNGRSVMYLTGRERGWIFLYEKVPQRPSRRQPYSQDELEEFAQSFADWPAIENITVGACFSRRTTAGMSDLGEGVLKKWSWKRIVLVGDACHKFAPNAGLGFNNGIQDVVALCNELRNIGAETADELPSSTIDRAFACYQASRQKAIETDDTTSRSLIRMQTWNNIFHFIMARILLSFRSIETLFINLIFAKATKTALVLNFLRGDDRYTGKVPWDHMIQSPGVGNSNTR